MAFVRGDRIGLIRLQRVLPSILKAFPGCDARDVLLECNLRPTAAPDGTCTFFFRPERDGERMIQPGESPPRKRALLTADELMASYAELSSSWRS